MTDLIGRVRGRVAQALFGDVIAARVREATLAEEDRGWRALSSGTARDVLYSQLVENLNDAAEAWRNNPLAFRIVELTTDYVLGKGMRIHAVDPDVQAFVTRFWEHPLNGLDTRQFDWSRELALSGEIFITFHTNPFDGLSYVRSVPAVSVDTIETNPDDLEDELRFHQLAQVTVTEGITHSGKSASPITGRWWARDEMRHYAVNRLVGTVRGQSDLAPLLPWLRRYKDWLTDRVRINKYRSAFLWDVELKGADRRALLSRQAELASPPAPGSVIVHNDSELWKAVKPEIGADDVESDGRAMRLMVAAGAGLPLHFLAEGEGANKATAAEMGGPTLRHFERRQLHFGAIVVDVCQHAARLSGQLEGKDLAMSAEFEDLSTQDNLHQAQALNTVVGALVTARDQGWLDDATARRLVAKFAGEPTLAEQP